MKENRRFANIKSYDRVMVRGTLNALALGMLLGGIWVLCSRWLDDPSILYIALQSAFSTMVFAILVPVWPKDLTLELQNLPTCPENGHSSAKSVRDVCVPKMIFQPGFAGL